MGRGLNQQVLQLAGRAVAFRLVGRSPERIDGGEPFLGRDGLDPYGAELLSLEAGRLTVTVVKCEGNRRDAMGNR